MDKNQVSQDNVDLNWFSYLLTVLKNKEFVVKITLAGTILTALISLFLPSIYLAETRILPPQTSSSSMAAAFASQMSGMGASVLGVKTSNDLYMELLKARSVSDFVSEKLGLHGVYGIASKEAMRNRLRSSLLISNDKRSGLMTIGYMDRNPRLAADIANAYVEGLQQLNNRLAVTEAATRRLFFEEQLKGAKERLILSEEGLKSFQQRTGTLKIDDEAKAAIESVAKMRAALSAKEVELNVMKSYATPQNPDLQRLQDEIIALKGELYRFESKTRAIDNSAPTVGTISSLGTEYLRRMREFKYNESLYEILMKQYGAAKLDESKDAALIQVVEAAVPPEQRVRPARTRMVIKTAALSLFVAIILVFLRIYWQGLSQEPETNQKLKEVKLLLDFSQLSKDLMIDRIYSKLRGISGKR